MFRFPESQACQPCTRRLLLRRLPSNYQMHFLYLRRRLQQLPQRLRRHSSAPRLLHRVQRPHQRHRRSLSSPSPPPDTRPPFLHLRPQHPCQSVPSAPPSLPVLRPRLASRTRAPLLFSAPQRLCQHARHFLAVRVVSQSRQRPLRLHHSRPLRFAQFRPRPRLTHHTERRPHRPSDRALAAPPAFPPPPCPLFCPLSPRRLQYLLCLPVLLRRVHLLRDAFHGSVKPRALPSAQHRSPRAPWQARRSPYGRIYPRHVFPRGLHEPPLRCSQRL